MAQHGKSIDDIDGDVRAKSKREGDGGSRGIDVWGEVADYSSQFAVIGGTKIGRVPDGATELDWLKGVRAVKINELSN
jgi:hypothetical protein